MTSLAKNKCLFLYCLFRQAERSVHFALSSPSLWPQFLAYYDTTRRARISEIVGLLASTGVTPGNVPHRDEILSDSFLTIVPRAIAYFCNSFKTRWRFSAHVISFYHGTSESLLKLLASPEIWGKNELIELRYDCFYCHSSIATNLIGVPELRRANTVEHFLSSRSPRSRYVRANGIDFHRIHGSQSWLIVVIRFNGYC